MDPRACQGWAPSHSQHPPTHTPQGAQGCAWWRPCRVQPWICPAGGHRLRQTCSWTCLPRGWRCHCSPAARRHRRRSLQGKSWCRPGRGTGACMCCHCGQAAETGICSDAPPLLSEAFKCRWPSTLCHACVQNAAGTAFLLAHWCQDLQRDQCGPSIHQEGASAFAPISVNSVQDRPPSLQSRASMSMQVHTFALALHAFALHLLEQGRVLPEVVLHG